MGLWSQYFAFERSASFGLRRNGVLALIALSAAIMCKPRADYARAKASAQLQLNRSHVGFTLIELLVVISIISIVIGLAVVGLLKAKSAAASVSELAAIRGHTQVMSVYSADHRGFLPWFTKRGVLNTLLSGGGVEGVRASYFDAHRTWHIVLSDGYYNGNAKSDVFFPKAWHTSDEGAWPFYTPYAYPCVFIASPEYWNVTTRIGPSQFRAMMLSDVTFPTTKSLVVLTWYDDRRAGTDKDTYRIGMVDGSTASLKSDAIRGGYERGDGFQMLDDGAVHFADAPACLHTNDGVRGRDIE
jgi:prepilin-type N-terminal cleavage/methylation domain-containing protein